MIKLSQSRFPVIIEDQNCVNHFRSLRKLMKHKKISCFLFTLFFFTSNSALILRDSMNSCDLNGLLGDFFVSFLAE